MNHRNPITRLTAAASVCLLTACGTGSGTMSVPYGRETPIRTISVLQKGLYKDSRSNSRHNVVLYLGEEVLPVGGFKNVYLKDDITDEQGQANGQTINNNIKTFSRPGENLGGCKTTLSATGLAVGCDLNGVWGEVLYKGLINSENCSTIQVDFYNQNWCLTNEANITTPSFFRRIES